jgi:hypothetical protein
VRRAKRERSGLQSAWGDELIDKGAIITGFLDVGATNLD